MSGETDLEKLLALLQPTLLPHEFVFCTVRDKSWADLAALQPFATCQEAEGMSLVLEQSVAEANGMAYDSVFRCITLSVHSSLDAVGLTAAVAGKLAQLGISANVVAAHYHDHVLVPAERAEQALQALTGLQR